MEKTIKYTVEFDTTKAEKAMADLQSNETGGAVSSNLDSSAIRDFTQAMSGMMDGMRDSSKVLKENGDWQKYLTGLRTQEAKETKAASDAVRRMTEDFGALAKGAEGNKGWQHEATVGIPETKGPSGPEHAINAPEIGKSIGQNFMANMKAGMPQMLGSLLGGGNLKSALGGMAGNITKAIGQSAGGASEAAAGAGGAAEGLGGLAAAGGPIGLAVAGIAALGVAAYKAISSLMDFGRTLSEYSGVLYQSVSNFDLKMQGLQIGIASKLGGAFSGLFDSVGGLLEDLTPIVEIIGGILIPIFTNLVNAIRAITFQFRILGEWILDVAKFIGWVFSPISDAVGWVVDAFKGAAKAIGEVVLKVGNFLHSDTLKDIGNMLTGQSSAADAAKEMNSALIGSLRDWAFNSKGIGMQGRSLGKEQISQLPGGTHSQIIHGNEKSPLEKMIHDSKHDAKNGLPKPSPAAMHYHQTDHIQMQLHDQDSVNQERLAFLDRVNDKITALRDITWLTRQKSIGQSFARAY